VLTALLGYGTLDVPHLGAAAANRAAPIAGGMIERDQRQTYEIPLPPSLSGRAELHHVTITLAYAAPTIARLTRYHSAKVYFATPDKKLIVGDRTDADHGAVRRGSVQHEVIEGPQAMTFRDGEVLQSTSNAQTTCSTSRRATRSDTRSSCRS
jgi:hypothetical protein